MSAIIPAVKLLLDSVRVLELTEALAGPYCAMLLGDFGADVIKLERPGAGDQSRGWGPPFVGSESAYFLAANRNKRSITVNFDQPRGAEILQRLLATADVLITNQPSLDSLQRRGLDPDTLAAKYPRLIHCSITGYGFTGPKAGRPGYDIVAQAEAGIMSFTGEPGGGPMRFPIAIADMTCGMYSAMGILAALYSREKTGQGQFLDMALFDSQLTWLANVGSSYFNANQEPERWGNAHPSIVPYEVFCGNDGRHFVIGVGTAAIWQRFVAMLGGAQLASDPRYATNALRTQNRSALIATLQKLFQQAPAGEWLQRLARAEIPAAAIHSVGEAVNDAQTIARNMIVQLEHPTLGTLHSIANPVHFSKTPVSYRLPPPLLGEHTREILRSLLFSAQDVETAAKESAI
jgi:crotonobetainyl-CoA:carnitine CoA-transferase CaiB-like acyl-CoA transferase